jgi:hypothetical protein
MFFETYFGHSAKLASNKRWRHNLEGKQLHPLEARADTCHARCAGVEGDFFRRAVQLMTKVALSN